MTNDLLNVFTFRLKDIIANDKTVFIPILQEYDSRIDYTVAANETFAEYLFTAVWRRYHNSEIMYDVPGEFFFAFVQIWDDIFDKYRKNIDNIQAVYELTEDDYRILNESITNTAFNPNDVPEDPWKMINFISQQTGLRNTSNRLAALLAAIQSTPALQTEYIIRDFGPLFTGVSIGYDMYDKDFYGKHKYVFPVKEKNNDINIQ